MSAETWFDSRTKHQLGPVASRVGQRLFNPQNRMGSLPVLQFQSLSAAQYKILIIAYIMTSHMSKPAERNA